MKIRSLLLVLFLVLVVAFVALNLEQILQPTSLNLGLATIQAPLGLAMLSLLALALLVFAVALAYLQTTHLMELRRAMKDVAEQRGLADQAEASRFTALQQSMRTEFQELKLVVEQTGNGLAASLGELEDRLERQQKPPSA
ncbi:LapA family protein [Hydrogenophaga sp.]|jgi:uncharacterized integral membrane protein|uniref:LapA family protein n=1 Tax=Hydrogenophaga sp. TaxID=1904254 RepID=UPI0035B03636